MAGAMATCPSASAAGAAPDTGELMKAIESRSASVPGLRENTAAPIEPLPRETENEMTTVIRGFRLHGVRLLPPSRLEAALFPFIGRAMGLAGLNLAAEKIMQIYREENYSAFAFLPPQEIVDGIVEIGVIEGRLAVVVLDTASTPARFDSERARRYIEEQIPVGAPLDMSRLERALLLLNDLHGIHASATLDAGREAGETKIIVRLADALHDGSNTGGISISNGGARSTGEILTDGFININNPARRGDQAVVRVIGGEGLAYMRVDYQMPVGYDGWKVGANAAHFRYRLIGDWAASQARGGANEWVLSAGYPIMRTRIGALNFVASFADKRYRNKSQGQDIGNKHVQIVNTGLAGGRHDGVLDGGYTGIGAAVTGGRLTIADAVSAAADAEGPRTAGNFAKLLFTASRHQNLTGNLSLGMNLSVQLANKNLDSSEKLYLGGPAGVRAYPSSEGGGDKGWMLNLHLRYRPVPALGLAVFADTGLVRQYHAQWAGQNGPNRVRLSGAGLALDWDQDGWQANIAVAWRIGDNSLRDAVSNADSDGTRRIPQVWMRLGKVF